jgi:hypothetical protein
MLASFFPEMFENNDFEWVWKVIYQVEKNYLQR